MNTKPPNYKEIDSCYNCKYAVFSYDGLVGCSKYPGNGDDSYICDEYEKELDNDT